MSAEWFYGFVIGMWVSIGLRDLGTYMRGRKK